jgi:CheY-like chemotaxis protein
MRIHTEQAQSFMRQLCAAINKDPSSLENWRCLHLSHLPNVSPESIEVALRGLSNTREHIDCEIIPCMDKDVLFISRSLDVDSLYSLADDFAHATRYGKAEICEVALYDMFRDWRIVMELLASKTEKSNTQTPIPTSHAFGNVEALMETFQEAKKARAARMPLHVMVVEDDPLTRRLVTGAFKDAYALITAENAQEAIANYLLHAPDIVFLDIGLPDTSGFEVLHQIMAIDSDAYVVMFSGNSYLDNVTAALNEGASGFIAKPFKKDKMRHFIHDSALHHRKYNA